MAESFGAIVTTSTAGIIVAANAARRNLTLTNNGTNDVFIGPDNTIATGTGIPLFGGSTRTQDAIPEGYKGDVFGISAANGDIRFWESSTP